MSLGVEETSFVMLVIVVVAVIVFVVVAVIVFVVVGGGGGRVIVVWISFIVVGRVGVNLEIGTAFVEVDDHKVDVDIDFDIISIVVSRRASSSSQKSIGLSFKAGDVGSITSLKKLVKSFAVSFVICKVDVDNISIAVSLKGIKIDQISFAVSKVVALLEDKSIAVSSSPPSHQT